MCNLIIESFLSSGLDMKLEFLGPMLGVRVKDFAAS